MEIDWKSFLKNINDGSVVGLDFSERRCGVAIYSLPRKAYKLLDVIHINQRKDFINELTKILEQHKTKLVIWGISCNKNGEVPHRFHFIKHMAHGVFQKTRIPYQFFNEFQSTILSDNKDNKAAKFILIGFLRRYIRS